MGPSDSQENLIRARKRLGRKCFSVLENKTDKRKRELKKRCNSSMENDEEERRRRITSTG